ncbi:MAG: TlpA disulfide reductase family protein [Balneolaceae bacterium]
MNQRTVNRSFIWVLTSVFLVVAGCQNSETESAATESPANEAAEQAPDFEVTTIDGETVSLASSMEAGRPLVIYFTASWCPVCARNWPVLSEVYPEYSEELDLVAISIDPTDTEEVIRDLANERGFTFPVTRGYPQVMVDYGVPSQASTVGVNRDGTIEFMIEKTALSSDEFRELFDRLLQGD